MLPQGPKGELQREFHPLVSVKLDGDVLTFERMDDSKEASAMHGMSR